MLKGSDLTLESIREERLASMKVNFHTARALSCDRVLVPKLEKEWS
jgi:hypothetical protein